MSLFRLRELQKRVVKQEPGAEPKSLLQAAPSAEEVRESKTTVEYLDTLQEKTEREYEEDLLGNITTSAPRAGKKRKTVSEEIVLPPIKERAKQCRDGAPKPPGVMFAATYKDADTLGKTLGKLEKFVDDYMLLFNEDGMGIRFLDRSHVMYVSIAMPRAAFARYDNLVQPAIDFIVTAKAMQQFGKLCKSGHSFTFHYDQCSLIDEPLDLLLYPVDGNLRSCQKIELTLPPRELEEPVLTPGEGFQYSVRMRAKNFAENVRALREQSDTIALSLTESHLAMMTRSGDKLHRLTMFVEHQDEDGELEEASCCIKRLVPDDGHIRITDFSDILLGAKYLESAAGFGNVADCDEVELRLGVVADGEQFTAAPLALSFKMRSGTANAFSVEVYIAPKIDE